jgi:hypothetical protein
MASGVLEEFWFKKVNENKYFNRFAFRRSASLGKKKLKK